MIRTVTIVKNKINGFPDQSFSHRLSETVMPLRCLVVVLMVPIVKVFGCLDFTAMDSQLL